MVAFDPNALPFYEVERGGGPVSEWKAGFDKALDAQQDHRLALLDPTEMTRRARSVASEDGGCTICGEPAEGRAHCGKCDETYEKQRRQSRAVLGMKRLPASSRTYNERRALGLCTVCEEPTAFARCDKCRVEYNKRHPMRQGRYREKQAKKNHP